jgi:hypothetical protein
MLTYARARLTALPPSICGIALGCVGMAGTLKNVDKLVAPGVSALSIPLYILSSLYMCVMCARIAMLVQSTYRRGRH